MPVMGGQDAGYVSQDTGYGSTGCQVWEYRMPVIVVEDANYGSMVCQLWEYGMLIMGVRIPIMGVWYADYGSIVCRLWAVKMGDNVCYFIVFECFNCF